FIFAIKNKDLKYLKKSLNNYLKGDIGEAMVINELMSRLDNSYTYITNYSNHKFCYGDIDGILLSKRGIFLIEVKNWSGSFRISGTDMYKHISKYLYKLYKSPIEQLANNKERMMGYLESIGIKTKVRPFVVLVSGRPESFHGSTGIFVATLDEMVEKIRNSPDHNLSEEEIDKILKVLEINKI
ncbi:NERD domain-containing protein, partial [Patescibacteria group bacterium]|nr:NERD domain-containing protein [Patescibacteria group bacterium]